MSSLTDFGDLAVLLPLAAAILLWLFVAGERRVALWWLVALTLCLGVIGMLKIYFAACPAGAMRSPSGHAGFSVLVYGMIAACLATRAKGHWRLIVLVGGGVVIAAIALSRLVLGVHTPIEIALGLLIGGASLTALLWGSAAFGAARPPLRPLLIAAVLIIVLLHGQELHAEAVLHAMGRYLARAGGVCS
ncbi:MAG TPA: phosphatase PAP2 family protein [Stellaceae bacterium]|nr:phosphatase PAP2 family protein [Stellaceae bacterium]